jgi:hypothetical protein
MAQKQQNIQLLPAISLYDSPGHPQPFKEKHGKMGSVAQHDRQRAHSRVNLMGRSLLGRVAKSRMSEPNMDLDEALPKVKKDMVRTNKDYPECALPDVWEQEMSIFSNSGAKNRPHSKARKDSDSSSAFSISRIDTAMKVVEKLKELRREDRELGVPRGFMFENSGCIIFEDDKSPLRRGRNNWGVTFKLDKKKPCPPVARTAEAPTHQFSPPGYKFPREADFIGSKAIVAGIGVQWNVKTPHMSETTPKRPNTMPMTTPGRARKSLSRSLLSKQDIYGPVPNSRCKSRYPVAEALKREGTSLEARKGKILQKGDWKIMKVWPREASQIQPHILPIEMANHDIPLVKKIKKMLIGKTKNKADTHSIEAHSTTCSSQTGPTEPSECNSDDAHLDNIEPGDATSPTSTDIGESVIPDLGAYVSLEQMLQAGRDEQVETGVMQGSATLSPLDDELLFSVATTPDDFGEQFTEDYDEKAVAVAKQDANFKSPTNDVRPTSKIETSNDTQYQFKKSPASFDEANISTIEGQSPANITQSRLSGNQSPQDEAQHLSETINSPLLIAQSPTTSEHTDSSQNGQTQSELREVTPPASDEMAESPGIDEQSVILGDELPATDGQHKRITFANAQLTQIPEEADEPMNTQ